MLQSHVVIQMPHMFVTFVTFRTVKHSLPQHGDEGVSGEIWIGGGKG